MFVAIVIRKAVELANEIGFETITLKLLEENLKVQPPSLYNHIKGIDDLQREIMLFGWKQVEAEMLKAAVCQRISSVGSDMPRIL